MHDMPWRALVCGADLSSVLRGRWRLCLSILAALIAVIAAVFGGGNGERNFNAAMRLESSQPQTFVVEHDADLAPAPVILAAPTASPAAPATPTVTAAAVSEGHGTGCPAVIVETFGDAAPAACAVAWCESRWQPHAVGDSGNSLGLFQLWTGWAAWYGVSVDALFDPAVNAAVAKAVYEYRGRWGGKGGWTCADLLNIP